MMWWPCTTFPRSVKTNQQKQQRQVVRRNAAVEGTLQLAVVLVPEPTEGMIMPRSP